MDRPDRSLTPERYARGMTFDQYLAWIATDENLRRESSGGGRRRDWSGFLRQAHERARLSEAQAEALAWIAARPGAPRKVLMISEEWSSDCRRDLPVLARFAEQGGMELRIFPRDGERFSSSPRPDPAASPNADLMARFLNEKNGQVFQSIPVIAFYTERLEYLGHYVEYPAIYHKDRIVYGHIRAPRPGETPAQTAERGEREFAAFQTQPWFRVWAAAAVDDWLSLLHRRLLLGTA
jgi:hypothetical protein